MQDNALIDLLASRLEAATLAAGWLDVNGQPYGVSQKEQPTQQGIPVVPQVFFEKLFDHAYGFPALSYSVDNSNPNAPVMTETETRQIETTFQISALVPQDPTDLSIPTASDVVNAMHMFLSSRATIRLWQPQGVSILRVTAPIQNTYFEDDRHRNAASPSFDIVLTHSQVINTVVNSTNQLNGNGIYPI